MTANELRIGNYIGLLSPGIESQCRPEHIKFISEGDTMYKPIPLTEEWLVKFGAKIEENNGCDLFVFDFLYLNKSPNGPSNYGCSLDHGNNDTYFTEIEHVHQLQNLYFALTGEELTIKS